MRRNWLLLLSCTVLLLGPACVEKNPDAVAPGRRPLSRAEKRKVAAHIKKTPPKVLRYRVGANLDNKLVYLGCQTPTKVLVPGKPFTVIHYFQVKQAVPGWKLFVHTSGPKKGQDHRNFDHVPVFGLYPVTKWKPGEIIEDRHTIRLPVNTPYKTVTLYVGVWRGRDRLKVLSGPQDGQNRVIAARIPVGKAGARVARRASRPRSGAALPRYVVRRASGPIHLDGKATEPDWVSAPATRPWVDSLTGRERQPRTTAKLLWDDKYLYVFFRAEDDDVWATVTRHDDPKLWTEQAFEVYLDADGDGATYVELQVNPRGATFDAYLPRAGQTQADWESGMKARASVEGTLAKRTDKDKGWQVELAIPWAAVRGRASAALRLPPRPGDRFRADFYRTDKPLSGPLHAWAWSPPRRSTFHAPDRFGTLIFADAKGATQPAARPAARPGMGRPAAARPAARPGMGRSAAARPAARARPAAAARPRGPAPRRMSVRPSAKGGGR